MRHRRSVSSALRAPVASPALEMPPAQVTERPISAAVPRRGERYYSKLADGGLVGIGSVSNAQLPLVGLASMFEGNPRHDHLPFAVKYRVAVFF